MNTRKDMFGTELSIGDTVAFNPPKYKGLVIGKILGFTPKSIRVEYSLSAWKGDFTTVVTQVVKKPYTYKQPTDEPVHTHSISTKNIMDVVINGMV